MKTTLSIFAVFCLLAVPQMAEANLIIAMPLAASTVTWEMCGIDTPDEPWGDGTCGWLDLFWWLRKWEIDDPGTKQMQKPPENVHFRKRDVNERKER